jgi:hypothetical protein
MGNRRTFFYCNITNNKSSGVKKSRKPACRLAGTQGREEMVINIMQVQIVNSLQYQLFNFTLVIVLQIFMKQWKTFPDFQYLSGI